MNLDDIRARYSARLPEVIGNLRAKAAEHDAPRREAGYTIQNATGAEAIVRIYDEIWQLGVNALDLTADLDTITAPSIRVEINSPGGDVFDGIAIYNALRTHPAHVTTRVDGLAASIASVIAQAGDHRVMVDSSQMMIHNAWGLTVGNQSDHEEMAALLAQQDEVIAGIYATNAGKDAAHFLDLMNAETWLTAERAVAEGLADEVLTPAKDKPKDSLADRIKTATSAVHDVISGAEQLVAAHAEAGSALTGAKRDGLVALRDALAPVDGLLNDGEAVTQETTPDAETANRLMAYALADVEWSSSNPLHNF